MGSEVGCGLWFAKKASINLVTLYLGLTAKERIEHKDSGSTLIFVGGKGFGLFFDRITRWTGYQLCFSKKETVPVCLREFRDNYKDKIELITGFTPENRMLNRS